jgi:hypothetical protein
MPRVRAEPEGRQQLPRLIRGFCGILFDGGFHPPDPPGLKDFWSELRELDALLHCPKGTTPTLFPRSSGQARGGIGSRVRVPAGMMLPGERRR